ncbi:MAG: response regulator transcription factor [Roseiflexaceae bacterium]|nr:response regulator transcription factor [Roseiflexaceae bacterium]
MSIAILIVDDHPVFRFGLRALIGAEPDMLIAGEAASGTEALAFSRSQPTDLVLMDINLPDINGIEVTRRLRALRPEARVLIISMLDDATVFQALKAGACGYILKGASGEETVRAIRAAAGGEAIFSPKIAQRIMQHFAKPPTASAFPELTEREREILALLAQGLTNSVIADRVSLSIKTVRNRVSDIFSKLQVSDRAEAIIKARDAGLK